MSITTRMLAPAVTGEPRCHFLVQWRDSHAIQHGRTFTERLADYPVRVEVLSRFRTAKEQKHALAELAEGKIDVVIGTHRLLSRDVLFKDLGLLVVDEEHRFGVRHKERLKELRLSIDVLTLTATPIPRTLHMSLAGLRDLTLIEGYTRAVAHAAVGPSGPVDFIMGRCPDLIGWPFY